jgi:hypothetical protein
MGRQGIHTSFWQGNLLEAAASNTEEKLDVRESVVRMGGG